MIAIAAVVALALPVAGEHAFAIERALVDGDGSRSFSFAFTADADAERALVLVRGPVGGHDDARVPGWLVDTASGRRAPVLVGHTVIVSLSPARASLLVGDGDVRVVRELMPSLGMVLLESTRGEDSAELAARLAALAQPLAAYPNLAFGKRVHAPAAPPFVPDDPRYPSQFYLEEIDIEAAWLRSIGSRDVDVLVADNGCDLAHPDLLDKLLPGVDPIDDDGDPSFEAGPANEHGTACAGLIAASSNNGTDIAGTCPECSLRCARLLPGENEVSTVASDVLTFQFALEVDADIVSNSWGFIDAIPVPAPLRDAILEVSSNGRGGLGAIVVFASGNDSRLIADDELLAVPGIIGVGAVNNLGELTQFSNGGPSVDIVAPTGSITTDISGAGGADPGDVTVSFGGTSSACPIVAGVVGLMLANDASLTAVEVNDALVGTAKQSIFATPTDDGHDDFYGFGLVQPAQALAFFDAPAVVPPEGCTCATTSARPSWCLLAVLLGTALLRRRRAHPLTPVQ